MINIHTSTGENQKTSDMADPRWCFSRLISSRNCLKGMVIIKRWLKCSFRNFLVQCSVTWSKYGLDCHTAETLKPESPIFKYILAIQSDNREEMFTNSLLHFSCYCEQNANQPKQKNPIMWIQHHIAPFTSKVML